MVAENGLFAARPSGTEDVSGIYVESFRDEAHLDAIVGEAQEIVKQRAELDRHAAQGSRV